MGKIWRCTLRVTSPHSQREADLFGYGSTPEKAVIDAKSVAQFRRETIAPGTKPHLDQIVEKV